MPLPRPCHPGPLLSHLPHQPPCCRQSSSLGPPPSLQSHSPCFPEEEWWAPPHCRWRSPAPAHFKMSRQCLPPLSHLHTHTHSSTARCWCQRGLQGHHPRHLSLALLPLLLQSALVPLFGFLQCIRLHQQGVHVCGDQAPHPIPSSLDGVLLLLPALPPSGRALTPQLLWSAAGGPSRPIGFCPSLQPLIERLKADVSGLNLNVWYLDDGILMGSPEDLATAVRIVESEGPPLGLHLNRNKSLLFIPLEADPALSPLPPDIPITRNGFTLLGCPIGPPDYCEEVFQARLSKVKVSLGALHGMGDAQLESTLLR